MNIAANDLKEIYNICENILNINGDIRIQRLGGMTNKNFKVETQKEKYVVRIPGEGTAEMINRKEEYISTKLANKLGIDAKLIYFDVETGIKISQYIDNAETMNYKTIKEPENMKLVAKVFNKLHNSDESIPVVFDIKEKIEHYEKLIQKSPNKYFWGDYHPIKEQIYYLLERFKKMNIMKTMCHNDPLCENFIKSNDRIYLIDWEYSGMNDPMWDLAGLFIEANFSPQEEDKFKDLYFNGNYDNDIEQRILMNKVFLDFLWALWGIQRYTIGDDLFEYGCMRYERAKTNLKLLM